jgi:hypothetical protein
MKTLRIVAIALAFLVSVNALLAGYSFMTEPSGAGLGTNVELLKHSPFRDFFVPGLILFSVNGVLSLFTGILLLMRKPYGFRLLILQGVLLGGWILIQIIMLREFNPLHFIFICIGLFFLVAGTYLHRKKST